MDTKHATHTDKVKPSYTPGPWEVRYDSMDKPFIIYGGIIGIEKPLDITEANARLIAAAPEILADAKVNAEWFENEGYPTEAANIRRLIAKAEGR